MKGQAIADHLAANPVEGYQLMIDQFLDESIQSIETEEEHSNWHMYFYGAINIHRNGNRAQSDFSVRCTLSSGNQIKVSLS